MLLVSMDCVNNSFVSMLYVINHHIVVRFRPMCLSFQMSEVLLPGYHIVMVTVANDLGNVSDNLNVSVLYPVTIRHITAKPVTLERPFVLEMVISGDLDFVLSVDLGDDSYVNGSTAELPPNIHITSLTHTYHIASAPVYLLELRHLYVTPGDYVVSVSVANSVSCVTNALTASVADSDFNVTLTSDCQSPVASNSLITLTATVTTHVDDDVSFNWTCHQCVYKPLVHRSVMLLPAFVE